MSRPCLRALTADDSELSDMASSSRNSESGIPQSPASPSPSSDSPAPQSPALLSSTPSPASRSLHVPEPAIDGSSILPTAEVALLHESEPSVRASDSPKRSRSRQRCQSLYQVSLSPWVWEVTSLFIALGLLVAMIVLISRASDKPVQSWTLPITLSALINTLSTVYRALLVYVAVEIVNQEKWIWLWSTPSHRPLRHLQYFEAGSRGLLGALKLMPLVARSSPSSLLALIVIILALAVGPFAQQSISIEYRATGTGTASLPVSYALAGGHALPGTLEDFYFRTFSADLIWWSLTARVRRALFSALANPSGNDSTIPIDCPTGNCAFPSWGSQGDVNSEHDVTHASIGMCKRCDDVTSLVSTRVNKGHEYNGTTIIGLPNGMELIISDSAPWLNVKSHSNLSWTGGIVPPETAAQMRWSFSNTTVLTMATDANHPNFIHPSIPVAATCSLYPCLRTYSASVHEGRLLEHELKSTPLYPDLGIYNGTDVDSQILEQNLVLPQSAINLAAIQSPCLVNNTIFRTENMSTAAGAVPVRLLDPNNGPDYPTVMAPRECTFRMNSSAFYLLRAVYSEQFLNGNCTWDARQDWEIQCPEKWWLAQFWETELPSVQSVEDRFGAIADATTNQFRLGVGRLVNSTEKVYGVALEQIPHTIFRWQWFLLPASLLVIDAVLLVWMVYRSIQHRYEEIPWKSSLLPLLYYRSLFEGADGEPLEAQTDFDIGSAAESALLTAAELENASKRVFVRLRRGKSHPAYEVEEANDQCQ